MARGLPEMSAKRSLFTSLKNINLFSHELAVMSRVNDDLKTNSELCVCLPFNIIGSVTMKFERF